MMDWSRNELLHKSQSQKTPLKEAKPDDSDYQISIDNPQNFFYVHELKQRKPGSWLIYHSEVEQALKDV